MSISFVASGSPTSADSLVIPASTLAYAYTFATHLQNNASGIYRFVGAFLEKILEKFSTVEHLGLTISKDISSTTNSPTSLNHDWTVTIQRFHQFDSIPVMMPVPSGGTNVGVGDFLITDIFAGTAKVASGANVSANVVVIPVEELQPFGCPAYADLDVATTDGRLLVAAIISYLVNSLTLRATGTTSAITAKSNNAPTIPTTTALGMALATSNPTSGITPADLFTKGFVSQQIHSLTIEMAEDPATRMFDVNVA